MVTKKMFDRIKWEGLEEQIKRVTGLKALGLDKELSIQGRIQIQSQNLNEYAGVMSSMYETLVINIFGGDFNSEENMLFLPIHFSWQYKSGGSNGHELFRAWYNFETNAWSFK